MEFQKIPLRRIAVILTSAIVIITIMSLTIGREIYGEKESGLLWFAFVHFLGYLFFLVMPVEMAFVYYESNEASPFMIRAIALITATLAQVIDYYIGYTSSTGVINNYIGRQRYEQAKDRIRKYGNITIFVFNLLPLSSPIIALAAGMLKLRLKDLLLYSIPGLVIKYLLLSVMF